MFISFPYRFLLWQSLLHLLVTGQPDGTVAVGSLVLQTETDGTSTRFWFPWRGSVPGNGLAHDKATCGKGSFIVSFDVQQRLNDVPPKGQTHLLATGAEGNRTGNTSAVPQGGDASASQGYQTQVGDNIPFSGPIPTMVQQIQGLLGGGPAVSPGVTGTTNDTQSHRLPFPVSAIVELQVKCSNGQVFTVGNSTVSAAMVSNRSVLIANHAYSSFSTGMTTIATVTAMGPLPTPWIADVLQFPSSAEYYKVNLNPAESMWVDMCPPGSRLSGIQVAFDNSYGLLAGISWGCSCQECLVLPPSAFPSGSGMEGCTCSLMGYRSRSQRVFTSAAQRCLFADSVEPWCSIDPASCPVANGQHIHACSRESQAVLGVVSRSTVPAMTPPESPQREKAKITGVGIGIAIGAFFLLLAPVVPCLVLSRK
eukprot:jgi/Botrbrau1/15293/Bobra.0371s0003.1